MPLFRFLALAFFLSSFSISVDAQTPITVFNDVIFRTVATDTKGAVRIAHDSSNDRLLMLTLGGDIYEVDPTGSNQSGPRLYSVADHGLGYPAMGMTVATDGTIYLVGNDINSVPSSNIARVMRGVMDTGIRTWEVVASTEAFGRSATNYDHNFNEIVLSPDEQFLFVNSGSRTDHGEVQSNNGQFPFAREMPITSAIVKIPASATDLVLLNDEQFLADNGYLFADGTRNTFSMAYDANGILYGAENSGDRDDSEELNVLVEGGHYGFPWRIGGTDTPQQFPDYDPSTDLLLNPNAGAVIDGHFVNDTRFPAAPAGTNFIDPIVNVGPDADLYRDPSTGLILDASEQGTTITSFTSHRSPLGLVFDNEGVLPEPYTGDALMLSWTGSESPLLGPFEGEGEDLLHLEISLSTDPPSMQVTRIATHFINPIDASLIGDKLYVLEFGGGARLLELRFVSSVEVEQPQRLEVARVEIFPNPARGRTQFWIKGLQEESRRVELFDVQGRLVKDITSSVQQEGRDASGILDTSSLPPGVYFLVTRLQSGISSKPFVVVE